MIAVAGRPDEHPLVHQALVYSSDAGFLAAAVPFCRDGLAAGGGVLVVATAATVDLLARALGGEAGGAGEVEFAEAGGWYDAPGRTLAAYGRYLDAHPRARVIAEPVWHGRTPAEEAEWTRYESAVNAAFAARAAWMVCAFDARAVPDRVVRGARRTHPGLLTGDGPRASADYVEPGSFSHDSDRDPLPPPPPGAAGLRFDGDLHRVRRHVRATAERLGLSRPLTDRLLLTVNEVAANAVEHGGGHGDLAIWTDGNAVVCDVTDPGRLTAVLPGYLPPAPTALRGHGLWVVRQLCDLLQVRSEPAGTRFRLHLLRD
ncbi:anti-sigma factor RsbA family regulatory protein [Nonomuraea sp. NPDC049684]|uniref:anti-sigma factor RsbA family regulatory protein n=1 Tax=Nonomuraea sp. NPDC049684 TaxID=3364356 RepID=UPI003795751F